MYESIAEHYKENYNNYLRPLQRNIGKDNAEECIQEAYTQLLEFVHDGGTIENITALMSTVLKRRVMDHIRKERQRGMVFEPLLNDIDVSEYPSDTIGIKQDINTLMKHINTKKGKHRDILILAFVQQIPSIFISKIVGISFTNVRQIVRRFRVDILDKDSNLLNKEALKC